MPDIQRPSDDPYSLIGNSWPSESESAYTAAESNASDASTTASTQAESARDAESKMDDERGKTASAVSGRYDSVSMQLGEQSRNFTTISAWMLDAAGKVGKAKNNIASLVLTGTQVIRDAIASETAGTTITPSSTDLITQYRNEIQGVNSKLSVDLDAIGHSLHGDAGSSNTPSYVSVPLTPTPEHPSPTAQVAAYNTGQNPVVEPHQLPEMPRAVDSPTTESSSTPSTPTPTASPHITNPTLAGLIAGSASPSGTPSSPSAKSPSSTTTSTPAGQGAQGHQPTGQHQPTKSTGLPRIPSISFPNVPAAAESITTAVSSATTHQLPTAPTSPGSSQIPASTGITPGVSGTPPVAPGLAPIGGGGLSTPPVQAPPVTQASPASPSPAAPYAAPQQSPPPAPRGPVADMAWLQRTYGLAPGLDLPKPENHIAPMLFIADLPEPEATLHRVLATLRHQFESAGWAQPLAVGLIKRGFETRTVYVTSDGLSIHPSGVLLPAGVTPLDEMPSTPTTSELSGSMMVTDKLVSLIPRGWEVESLLSTISGGEASQSIEEYQQLVESGELLECKVSRGRDDVTDDEALSVFARASIGSRGCGELDAESARIRAARWVGVQPAGYLDCLARWYLSDAAESMSLGRWGETVWACEKYMSVNQSGSQAA